MIAFYGIIGLVLIALSEINFFVKFQPFEKLYFPIIWIGYILFVDALVYRKKGRSLIRNNLPRLTGMFFISAPFWKVFEYINLRTGNWHYNGTEFFGAYGDLFAMLSFATVIPAFFETLDLFSVKIKDSVPNDRTGNKKTAVFIAGGLALFAMLILFPRYFFPVTWVFLFFITEPINYMNNQPSLLHAIKTKQFGMIKAVVFSSLILGFFWEFWNYWASVRWYYTVPFFDFLHIFEMPILGYLGYIPFAFEIYSFYFFIEFLFKGDGEAK